MKTKSFRQKSSLKEDEKMTNLHTVEATVLGQAEARKEPQWLLDLRKKSFQNIEALSLPTPDKTKIASWNFAVQEDTTSETIEIPSEMKGIWEGEDSNVIVLYKNQVVYQNTTEAFKKSGVVVQGLFDALESHEEIVKENLMTKVTQADAHQLTALHTALLNSGALIYAPKNVVLDEPIHVVFLQKGAEPFHNHVLLVADTCSQISYVETTFSLDTNAVPTTATICAEVIVNDAAKVTYGAIDALGENVTAYVSRQGHVGRDAELDVAHGALGENNAIFETFTHLYGEASKANTRTIAIGTKKQKQNFTVKTVHYGKHSEGFILNHGVGMDESMTIFNGIGKIEFGAVKSDAQQSSKLLMLNPAARGDANPILLIDEHDVMAGHAASVGKIDEAQMYYLMSRGLPKEEAERLIIHGFLAPVVAELPIEKVRSLLVRMIEGKVSK